MPSSGSIGGRSLLPLKDLGDRSQPSSAVRYFHRSPDAADTRGRVRAVHLALLRRGNRCSALRLPTMVLWPIFAAAPSSAPISSK